MKNIKRVFCAVLAVLMLFSLTACGKKGKKLSEEDAAALVQGRLDGLYKGEINDTYLKVLGLSEEQVRTEYEENLGIYAEFFARYFNVEYPTDELKAQLVLFFQELFSRANYTVGSVSKMEDGNFVVTVEVAPLDLVEQMDEAWDEWMVPFYAKYSSTDFTAMSDAEYQAMDSDWAGYVLDLAKDKLPGVGYMEAETLAVQVSKGDDGVWSISDDDIYTIDEYIVYF